MRDKLLDLYTKHSVIPKQTVQFLEERGTIPRGTTRQYGSAPKDELTAEEFNEAVEEALPDGTEEPVEVILDLPKDGWGQLKVGQRAVRSVVDKAAGSLYVEARPEEIYSDGLAFLDGEPIVVAEAIPLRYEGVPWSRVRIEMEG